MAINKTSETVKDAIKRKSAYSLPDRPSDMGMKPEEIKRAFWAPVSDTTNSIMKEIDRIVDDANTEFDKKLDKTAVVNNLLSNSTSEPLSAAMGKKLDDRLTKVEDGIEKMDDDIIKKVDVTDNLNSTSTDKPLSANMGKVLGEKIAKLLDSNPDSNPDYGSVIKRLTELEEKSDSYATLDSDGKIPARQLPSYVDDVLEGYLIRGEFYTIEVALEEAKYEHENAKIYVDKNTNKSYSWSGTGYSEIGKSITLGETENTAYSGAKGKKNAENIAALETRVGALEGSVSGADGKDYLIYHGIIPSWVGVGGEVDAYLPIDDFNRTPVVGDVFIMEYVNTEDNGVYLGYCSVDGIDSANNKVHVQGWDFKKVSGNDGKGISSATINSDGDLIITFTDGTSTNAGSVVADVNTALDAINGEVI